MEDYSYILNSNWFWCICGILGGGGLSLIISAYFHFIASKYKCISYTIETSRANINTNENNLESEANSHKNNIIYFSKITFRNVGDLDLEQNDFVPSCPLTISTDGEFIINDKNTIHLEANHYSNMSPIVKNDDDEKNNTVVNNVSINLDYLAINDTVFCSCFHTGAISVYALIKNGKIFNSFIITKCGRWYVQLSNFICIISIIFFILLMTVFIIAIIPELIK